MILFSKGSTFRKKSKQDWQVARPHRNDSLNNCINKWSNKSRIKVYACYKWTHRVIKLRHINKLSDKTSLGGKATIDYLKAHDVHVQKILCFGTNSWTRPNKEGRISSVNKNYMKINNENDNKIIIIRKSSLQTKFKSEKDSDDKKRFKLP